MLVGVSLGFSNHQSHLGFRLNPAMAQGLHFKTLDEFNRGYAGPQTLLLEKKCRGKANVSVVSISKEWTSNQEHLELAGRQDNFCLICGDDAVELFPQLGPKEIHLCPRRFCKK